MDARQDRRRESRIEYQWPVWFSEDFAHAMSQGLMVDISSGGICFQYGIGDALLQVDQHLTVRFSIPRFQGDDPTATVSITRTGHIRRIDAPQDGQCRVALEFDIPLALRPSEVSTLSSLCRNDLV